MTVASERVPRRSTLPSEAAGRRSPGGHRDRWLWMTLAVAGAAPALHLLGQYYVRFTPSLNDILGVYGIAALPDRTRWINGFYGPAYTLIHDVTGGSLASLAVVDSVSLSIALGSSLILTGWAWGWRRLGAAVAVNIAFYGVLCWLMLGNYTDSPFLFVLATGFNVFALGVMPRPGEWPAARRERSPPGSGLAWVGLVLMGTAATMRQHGLAFALLVVAAVGYVRRDELRTTAGRVAAVLALPTLALGLFAFHGVPLVNWQKFNVYKMLFGVDWYGVDSLIRSADYIRFSTLDYLTSHPAEVVAVVAGVLYDARSWVTIVVLTHALCWLRTRSRTVLAWAVASLAYLALVAPGMDRGIYPVFLLTFHAGVVTVADSPAAVWSKPSVRVTAALLALASAYVFLISPGFRRPVYPLYLLVVLGLLGGGASLLSRRPAMALVAAAALLVVADVSGKILGDLRNLRERRDYWGRLESTILELGANGGDEVFTDEFGFYMPRLGPLRTYQGWMNLHPAFGAFRPSLIRNDDDLVAQGVRFVLLGEEGPARDLVVDSSCRRLVAVGPYSVCDLDGASP